MSSRETGLIKEMALVNTPWWKTLIRLIRGSARRGSGGHRRAASGPLTEKTVEAACSQVRRAQPTYQDDAVFWGAHEVALSAGTNEDRRIAALALYDAGMRAGMSAKRVTSSIIEGVLEGMWPTD